MSPLLELARFGRSYWLDDLSRPMIDSGELQRRVSEEGRTGVTAKPAIFGAAAHNTSAAVAAAIATCMLLATAMAVADGQSAHAAIPPITAPDESKTSSALYTVRDGNQVDAQTLAGWKTWRALACERCHGAAQEGLVGPALVESLKTLTKDEFHTTIMNGRLEKGMPSFSSSKMVTENWEGLYAYLKGRSDDQIQPGRLSLLE